MISDHEELIEDARRVSGKDVLILGGILYRDAWRRMEDAFDCRLHRIHFDKEDKGTRLRSANSADYCFVLVKLCSHEAIDEMLSLKRAGITSVVLLKAGYNPARIAHELAQMPA